MIVIVILLAIIAATLLFGPQLTLIMLAALLALALTIFAGNRIRERLDESMWFDEWGPTLIAVIALIATCFGVMALHGI